MKRKVVLHGYLKRRFGESFILDIESPAEAVRALAVQLQGFVQSVRCGEFRVLRGKTALDESELTMSLNNEDLHIVPMPVGSKRNGLLKVILGVAMIGIGLSLTNGALAFGKQLVTMGAGMLLNGLGQMLSPTPKIDSNESADTKQSYTFGGAVNLTEEGNIVPVVYGKMWCGSVVISAGMDVEEVR